MLWLLLGAGLVLVIEGLVLALAPSRVEALFLLLISLPVETRRLIGLGALALGTVLVWLARGLLAG